MPQAAVKIMERSVHEKVKALRRKGNIPGIIYGQYLDNPTTIKIVGPSLNKLLKDNSKGTIVRLNLNDKIDNYIVKHVQKNALTGDILHVDFQYISKNEVVKMKIPVEYVGVKDLETKKLYLNVTISEIEMQGDAEEIPEYIKIQVSQMEYGHKIFASSINLPDGVKLLTNPDVILAIVMGK